jgi:hypothetical protein
MNERSAFCLDVGGTRLKWCFLTHDRGHVENWPTIKVCTMRSAGWLNATLPDLFRPSSWAGIAAREPAMQEVDDLCIAVNSPVLGRNRTIGGRLAGWQVPPDLYSILVSEYPGRRINLINDAEAAFHGFIRFTKQWNVVARSPFLVVTLGTSVGIVVAKTEHDIELSEFDSRIGGGRLGIPADRFWEVHELLGGSFFATVTNKNRDWSYYAIRDAFTERMISLIKDCFDAYGRARTVVIAGGNAEYVSADDLADACGTSVSLLTHTELPFNPDAIPLVGVL